VGAVATGVEALNKNSDLTHAKTNGPSSAATLDSLSSQAHAFALASDIMTAAAVVTGGLTLYFSLRSPARQTSTAPAPVVEGFSLGIGAGRVGVRGEF
jgi:hypothetical protein